MAGVSKYTESDRAAVYFSLQVNAGNVKRTARETGYPESTVRLWKKEFSEKGPPSTDAVEAVSSDFIADGERIRNKALMRAEKMIDDTGSNLKLAELTAISGMLTDKLNVALGLATKRVEHQHHLPSADEARELLRGFADEMAALTAERDAEIIDAEIVEQRALPSAH
jgi:transposase-like protein